jgi:hypothetical protein
MRRKLANIFMIVKNVIAESTDNDNNIYCSVCKDEILVHCLIDWKFVSKTDIDYRRVSAFEMARILKFIIIFIELLLYLK